MKYFEEEIEKAALEVDSYVRENYGLLTREQILSQQAFANGLRRARAIWEECEED